MSPRDGIQELVCHRVNDIDKIFFIFVLNPETVRQRLQIMPLHLFKVLFLSVLSTLEIDLQGIPSQNKHREYQGGEHRSPCRPRCPVAVVASFWADHPKTGREEMHCEEDDVAELLSAVQKGRVLAPGGQRNPFPQSHQGCLEQETD